MSSRAARKRVLKRDKRICGAHLGGCKRTIAQGVAYTRDHIIPRALFSKVAKDRVPEFNRDWNCQPMHDTCNKTKSFQMTDWPEFDCQCHYLQVVGDDLYIFTKGSIGDGRHLLLSEVVSHHRDRVDARVVFGSGRGPGGRHFSGYMDGRIGYLLPGIAASAVEMFNLSAQGRAGLQVPKHIYVDERGHIQEMPGRRVAP